MGKPDIRSQLRPPRRLPIGCRERVSRLWSIGLNIVFSPMLQIFEFASAFPENRVTLFGPML